MKPKVIFNWSGGKDSAFCLHKILQSQEYEVMCLLTSVSSKYQRVSMHGVRIELMEAHAKEIGIPLVIMQIPENPSMEDYERVLMRHLSELKSQGAVGSVYGDIFLEDLRAYREKQLEEVGLKGIFPLWKIPTDKLIREFIETGFKTIVTCVNEKYLDKSFAGRVIDHEFLKDLPADVDPCGENGEFHTFVFEGPLFGNPIPIAKGEVVYKKYSPPKKDDASDDCFKKKDEHNNPYEFGFWYADILSPVIA